MKSVQREQAFQEEKVSYRMAKYDKDKHVFEGQNFDLAF